MSSAQQIQKLEGHVLIFSEELRSLIQSFELLFIAAEDQELLQKISGTKRARGFSVNRWSLIQECIIGIAKLAYDSGPQNPTAARLIEDILNPQADGLREKLKARFVVPIKPSLVPGRPPTKEDLAVREEIERREIEELKQAFDQVLVQFPINGCSFGKMIFWVLCRQDLRPERWNDHLFFGQRSEVELVFLDLLC
jgi:hypothetical protein